MRLARRRCGRLWASWGQVAYSQILYFLFRDRRAHAYNIYKSKLNEEALLFPDFVSNQSQIPNTDHKVREKPPLSSVPSIIFIFLKVNAVLS